MKVAIGCDHAGFPMKEIIAETIRLNGCNVIDLGSFSQEPVDYPEYAEKVCHAIQNGEANRGILICGSGVAMCITANKLQGIRAGLCHDTYSARQSVEHDNANVLAIGARVIGPALAIEIVRVFLSAKFSGDERHVRRLAKLSILEKKEANRNIDSTDGIHSSSNT